MADREHRALVTDLSALEATGAPDGYREFLRVPAMSLGLFKAAAGYVDNQQPHAEDEVYVVMSGSAILEIAGEPNLVTTGAIAFVAAHVPHHFYDISTDLRVLVLFAPAQT